MDDKAAAALEQLEAEKEKRIQARIDAGELGWLAGSANTIVELGDDREGVRGAEARSAEQVWQQSADVAPDFSVIVTGVPRPGWL